MCEKKEADVGVCPRCRKDVEVKYVVNRNGYIVARCPECYAEIPIHWVQEWNKKDRERIAEREKVRDSLSRQ